MTTASEHLSHLIGGEYTYVLPDLPITLHQFLQVSSVDVTNKIVTLGGNSVPAPDPVNALTLDPVTHVLDLALRSGVKFNADLSKINTDVKLDKVYDVGKGSANIAFELSDGTTLTYTPTTNDPKLKADKTVKIVSKDTALVVKEPTLKDDVNLELVINKKNGLVKLSKFARIPTALNDPTVVMLPSGLYNPAMGTSPVGTDGQVLIIEADGNMNVVPIGDTTANPMYKVLKGDWLRYMGGAWHLVVRSNVDHLKASQINVAPYSDFLAQELQDLVALQDKIYVRKKRKITSQNQHLMTFNGKVFDNLKQDILVELLTNRAQGLAELDSAGQLSISVLPTTAFEYHGGIDPNKPLSPFRPKHNTADPDVAWVSGDTVEVLVDSTGNSAFPFSDKAKPAVAAPLFAGDILIHDGLQWVKSASKGHVEARAVTTMAAALHLDNLHAIPSDEVPANLGVALANIDSNAAFKASRNSFTENNEFQATTTIRKLNIGGVGTETEIPTTVGAKETVLITDGVGVATWDYVPLKTVHGTIKDLSGTNLLELLETLRDKDVAQAPMKTQTLKGLLTKAHTALGATTGVIVGDATTDNQIANLVLRAGVVGTPLAGASKVCWEYSTTTKEVPPDNSLLLGQPSVNLTDKRLFVGGTGGHTVELDFKELPTLAKPLDLLRIDAAGTGVEWATTDDAAIIAGGKLDVTLDPTTITPVPTKEVIYTVKGPAKAHGNFNGLAGVHLPKDAVILRSTNGFWSRLDQIGVGSPKLHVGDAAPTTYTPVVGDMWFKTDLMRMFVLTANAGHPAWVDASPAVINFDHLKDTKNGIVYADTDGNLKRDLTGLTIEQKFDLLGISKADLKAYIASL